MNTLEDLIEIAENKKKSVNFIHSNPTLDYDGWRNEYNETIAQVLLQQHFNDHAVIAMFDHLSLENIKNIDNDGRCLITSAVSFPKLFNMIVLTDGIDINIRNENDITLFAAVCEIGNITGMHLLYYDFNVDINDKESDSALILASMNDQKDVIKLLLSWNVDLEEYFLEVWGKEYINELKNYSRINKFLDIILASGLTEIIPQTAQDVFLF
jgi:hypothetical protein